MSDSTVSAAFTGEGGTLPPSPSWARLWLSRSLEQPDAVIATYEAARLALAEKVCRQHGLTTGYEGFDRGREAGSWLWAAGVDYAVVATVKELADSHSMAGMLVDAESGVGSPPEAAKFLAENYPASIARPGLGYQCGVLRASAEWSSE